MYPSVAQVFGLTSGLIIGTSFGWGLAHAQTPTSREDAQATDAGPGPPVSRFYGSAEYLLWDAKDAPLSVPLVSTGPIATTHHGLLGPPAESAADSTVLYGAPFPPAQGGNDTQDFPLFSGGRLTLGYWLDDARHFAIEGTGFALQERTAGYSARGDANGNPVLGFPVNNTVPYQVPGEDTTVLPGEDSLPFALPDDPLRARNNGIITGGVVISNSLRFWGTGGTGVATLYRDSAFEVSGLAGFSYLQLSESFNLFSDIEGITGPYAGESGTVRDTFETRNEFYGASFGLRGRYSHGPLFVELTGRVSPGVSHEAISISGGFSAINFPTPSSSGPEGVFAQPANEGEYSSNDFAVVPEAQVTLGYALTPRLRATVGYDVLYYSSVVRPTDQINRNVPKGQTFLQAAPPISTTSPSRLFYTTDFWVQGLTVGLVFSLGEDPPSARESVSSVVPSAPSVTWTGFYIGGNVGGDWGSYEGTVFGGPTGIPLTSAFGDSLDFSTVGQGSLSGGGQLGLNWQVNRWVFGIEGSAESTSIKEAVKGTGSVVFTPNNAFRFDNDWKGSLRTRVGFAIDRWLAYVTGGLAWSQVSVSGLYGSGTFYGGPAGSNSISITQAASAHDRHTLLGGTGGVGLEYALTNNLSIGAEYRYTEFDPETYKLGAIPFPGMTTSSVTAHVDEPTNEVTMRLNYRFAAR